MEFRRIFTNSKNCKLWSVCYPEHTRSGKARDIFRLELEKLSDTDYLENFFTDNIVLLNSPFWGRMSIDEAIDKTLDEIEDFETELSGVVNRKPGFENISLSDIFKKLHKKTTALTFESESHRKAKPNVSVPFLRFYGIELDDGTIIITGVAIKLTRDMEGDLEDQHVFLKRVQKYIEQEKIVSKEGLE